MTKLPPELLDAIIIEVYNDTTLTRPTPICKALLPFQRRRITALRLHESAKKAHLQDLFPCLDNLTSLTCFADTDLPSLLSLLPKPTRIVKLVIHSKAPFDGYRRPEYARFPGVSSSLAAPLSTFTALARLELHCPCDISSPAILTALHQTSLKHLKIGFEARETVKLADFVPLVSTSTRPPHLESLSLGIAYAEEGCSADEVEPPRTSWFYESWKLPEWPSNFPREDVQKLEELSEVEVCGDAFEAMDLEEDYEKERKRVERDLRDYWEEVRAERSNEQSG